MGVGGGIVDRLSHPFPKNKKAMEIKRRGEEKGGGGGGLVYSKPPP